MLRVLLSSPLRFLQTAWLAWLGSAVMLHSPSADRNKGPLLELFSQKPPFSNSAARAKVLEIGSGTGQHVAHFAAAFPHCDFQPTEYGGGSAGPESAAHGDELAQTLDSIAAYTAALKNVAKPVVLDCKSAEWPEGAFDAICCCNVLHISPFEVSLGLIKGAGKHLVPGGHLYIYGPFLVCGEHTAPSNAAFDERLRSQNAEWGVRCSDALAAAALAHGLDLVERTQMPANNFVLHFRKQTA